MLLISSKQFTYDRKLSTYISELSTVGTFITHTRMQRDCMYVKSAKTGMVIKFVEDHKHYEDGELLYVVYRQDTSVKPTNSADNKFYNSKLLLFND